MLGQVKLNRDEKVSLTQGNESKLTQFQLFLFFFCFKSDQRFVNVKLISRCNVWLEFFLTQTLTTPNIISEVVK